VYLPDAVEKKPSTAGWGRGVLRGKLVVLVDGEIAGIYYEHYWVGMWKLSDDGARSRDFPNLRGVIHGPIGGNYCRRPVIWDNEEAFW
jgi:hypothetical protein